jgi:thioredoxin
MSSKIVTLTADSFDQVVLGPDQVAVVDFWAPWCPPCRALAPSIEALAEERPDLVVGKLDVDDHPGIAERYGVSNIPTVIVFRGGKEAESCVGLVPLDHLRRLVGARAEATAGTEATA